jgi:hypothetical protein
LTKPRLYETNPGALAKDYQAKLNELRVKREQVESNFTQYTLDPSVQKNKTPYLKWRDDQKKTVQSQPLPEQQSPQTQPPQQRKPPPAF